MPYKILNQKNPSWLLIDIYSIDYLKINNKHEICVELNKFIDEVMDFCKKNSLITKINNYEYIPLINQVNREPNENQINNSKYSFEGVVDLFEIFNNKAKQLKKTLMNLKKDNLIGKYDVYSYEKNFLNPFLKSAAFVFDIKNKKIEIQEMSRAIDEEYITKGYICVDSSGFVGHKGQSVSFSEARIFSSPQLASRRFPDSNVFPVELRITGKSLEHKKNYMSEKAKELNISLSFLDLNKKMENNEEIKTQETNKIKNNKI